MATVGDAIASRKKLINGGIVAAGVVLLALVVIVTCFSQVNTSEVAVVTQFGKITGTEGEGAHFKLPWQTYNIIKVSQSALTDDYSTATKDQQSLNQTVVTQYTIEPDRAEDVFSKFKGAHEESLIMPQLQEYYKEATSKYSIEEAMADRGQLSGDMLKKAQDELAPYGIKIISVAVKDIHFPEEYGKAVERRKVAEQDLTTAKVNKEKAVVQAETNTITSSAYTDQIYRKEWLSKWNGVLPTTITGDNTGVMIPTK